MSNNIGIGSQIGNYSLVKFLGSGSFGYVYQARHRYLNRSAAIKLLLSLSNKKDERISFFKEAEFLDMLKHRHVLPIIDVGEQGDLPYIIMEYASGGSLADLIPNPKQRLPMRQALRIIAEVGVALQFAHQKNVVHRDLKPANILFNEKGEVVLADFGISVLLSHGHTTRADIRGSCPYMPPEQFGGEVSVKSDQYALACIAYLLFTGELPIILPPNATIQEWALKVINHVPVKPRQINPDVPVYIEEAILKALAKERNQRHVDVNAFVKLMSVVPGDEANISALIDPPDFPTIFSDLPPTEVESAKSQFSKTVQQWVKEGNAHYDNGDFEEALSAYRQAILISPDKDILYNLKGKALYSRERFQEAVEAYNKAILLTPDKAIFYVNRGEAFRSLRDFSAALADYEQAIQLDTFIASNAKVYVSKGDAHAKLGNEKEALDSYERACQLEPKNPLWHRTKGDMLRQLRHFADAFTEFDLALQLAGNDEALKNSLQNRKKAVLRYTTNLGKI